MSFARAGDRDHLSWLLLSRNKFLVLCCILLFMLGTTAVHTVLLFGSDTFATSSKTILGRRAGAAVSAASNNDSLRRVRHKQGHGARSGKSRTRGGPSRLSAGNGRSKDEKMQIGSVVKDLKARKSKSRPKARTQEEAAIAYSVETPSKVDETGAYIWMETEFEPELGSEIHVPDDLMEAAITRVVDIEGDTEQFDGQFDVTIEDEVGGEAFAVGDTAVSEEVAASDAKSEATDENKSGGIGMEVKETGESETNQDEREEIETEGDVPTALNSIGAKGKVDVASEVGRDEGTGVKKPPMEASDLLQENIDQLLGA